MSETSRSDTNRDTASLDARFAGGLAWTAGAKWATQLFSWGSIFILARLLSPADYGLGAMASSFFLISNVMAEFGVGIAVVMMPELTKKQLAQFHGFSCILCSAFFVVGLSTAPWMAAFYHSDKVLYFMANATGLLITGFQAIPNALIARDMDYRRLALAEAALVSVQMVVSVVTAWLGWGYWALLVGPMSGQIVQAVLTNIWKPVGFAWPRWNDIKAPFHMGRQSATGRIAWAIYARSDGIAIGRLLGDSVRGIYGMAVDLAYAPSEKVCMLLMRTSGPLFANVKDDLVLVRRYSLILAEVLSLTVAPLMAGLAMVAPVAIPVIFGEKWLPAVGPVRWLAIYQIVRTSNILTEQILTSQRWVGFTMKISITNAIVMPVAFVIGAKLYGVEGVAGSWLVLAPLSLIPLTWALRKSTSLPLRDYLMSMLPATVSTSIMCVALFFGRIWLEQQHLPRVAVLVALIAIGAIIYIGTTLALFGKRVARYKRFLQNLRQGKSA